MCVTETTLATLSEGKVVSKRVTLKISSKIEKGVLSRVNALVVHQTGSGSAESSFNSYKNGGNGAHFLIDKDGTIYQTARVTQRCWHVGKIQSRCSSLQICSVDELKKIKSIMFNQADSYATRVKSLNDHEMKKSYPDRYPSNDDSIGIELVAAYSTSKGYETATDTQNVSLGWLVSELGRLLKLTGSDIYRHPEVSYKQATEGKSAKW